MRGLKVDRCRAAAAKCFHPARNANAPAIAWFQARKAPFGMRGDEVVAVEHREIEELLRHRDADGMQAPVFRSCPAVAVAVEPGEGIAAAAFQFRAEDVCDHGRILATD